jgi:ABC-type phosphate transport system ATPase subunit
MLSTGSIRIGTPSIIILDDRENPVERISTAKVECLIVNVTFITLPHVARNPSRTRRASDRRTLGIVPVLGFGIGFRFGLSL